MANFSDLLKKWFYTNSSSAASSDARIPLLTSTGEPKGSDTMAKIASVLGGLQVIDSTTLANGFNTDVRYSFLTFTTTYPEGWPFDYSAGGGYLVQFYIGEGLVLQIAVVTGGSNAAIRTKWFGSNFNAWHHFL